MSHASLVARSCVRVAPLWRGSAAAASSAVRTVPLAGATSRAACVRRFHAARPLAHFSACPEALVSRSRVNLAEVACGAVRVGGVRRMGIMDSWQSALDSRKADKMEQKKTEMFNAQITYIAGCKQFTMDNHITMVQDVAAAMGLTGWRSKIRSSSAQKELLDKYPELLVAEKLTDGERQDPTTIKRKEKKRLATECGVGVDIVNRFLRSYDANRMLHRFVSNRKAKNLPLPKTHEEYSRMLASDPGGMRGRDARKSFGRVRSGRAALSRQR